VLGHLALNCGRLVSKDALFAAVWPNIAVTDDALVQSISELRRALAEAGPRLIKTVARRGYRFEAEVRADLPGTAALPEAAGRAVPAQSGSGGPAISAAVAPPLMPPLLQAAASRRSIARISGAVLLLAGLLWVGNRIDWNSFGRLRTDTSSASKAKTIAAKPAIGVLAFVNQAGPGSDYFADGLTQDIINALGRFSELTVMSWNAVFPYKGKVASPGEIAQRLAVRYQVEGSVLRTPDRVRVSAQLVDSDGRVLWSARFDEALADIFALQDKIARQIAGALAIRVTQVEQRRVLTKPTESLEAYEYLLRARPALQRPARADLVEARALLRRALALDPSYAAAYAALADTYHLATVMGWAEAPDETLGRAEEFAAKALSIDDSEVRAHTILGRIHIFHQRYEQAKAEMDRAIAINPNDALGLAGRGNLLMWLGQTDAAIEALELARRIDPELNALDRNALSLAYYLKGRYEAAIEEAKLNLRRTTSANFTRVVLAAAYAQGNQPEEAARVVSDVRRLDPTFDPREFGSKFLRAADLEHLRDGIRKAGLDASPRANER
jgi:TolB-like protein/Tfp pilus assembly protein PilF